MSNYRYGFIVVEKEDEQAKLLSGLHKLMMVEKENSPLAGLNLSNYQTKEPNICFALISLSDDYPRKFYFEAGEIFPCDREQVVTRVMDISQKFAFREVFASEEDYNFFDNDMLWYNTANEVYHYHNRNTDNPIPYLYPTKRIVVDQLAAQTDNIRGLFTKGLLFIARHLQENKVIMNEFNHIGHSLLLSAVCGAMTMVRLHSNYAPDFRLNAEV